MLALHDNWHCGGECSLMHGNEGAKAVGVLFAVCTRLDTVSLLFVASQWVPWLGS